MKVGYVVSGDGKVQYKFFLPDSSPFPTLKTGELYVLDPDLKKANVGDTVTWNEDATEIINVTPAPTPTYPPSRLDLLEERVSKLEAAIEELKMG